MDMTSRLPMILLALIVLIVIALVVAVPSVLGARTNELRLDISARCSGESSSHERDITINIRSHSRGAALSSLTLEVLNGSDAVISERYPDIAGNFKDTAEGQTSDGPHHLSIDATTPDGELVSLHSVLDVSPGSCVASNKALRRQPLLGH